MQLTMVYAAGNSLGRAYCIWLIARQLGWDASVYSIGDSWGPLKGTGMPVQKIQDLTEELLSSSDVVIVYQPLPETLLDVLPKANRHGVPVIVDIDDPHWEGRYGFDLLSRIRVVLALMRRGRSPFPPYAARRAARPLQVMTASPFVQDRWPGVLIPHVRPAFPETDMPEGESLRVGFIGSVRPHKGLDLLRSVANEVEGVELFITAPQPDDHRDNEHWVGETSLQEGQELLTQVHMSAVLQAPGRWGERQFPVKIVDAMMSGRVVLGSDVAPVRWAVGGTGFIVAAGDRDAVRRALEEARDGREKLRALGTAAREQALARYTPQSVAPALEQLVFRTIQEAGKNRR